MIPKHIHGMSVNNIVDEVKRNFDKEVRIDYYREYAQQLEKLLKLAVKDALRNISSGDHGFIGKERGINAEQRAIAFLNIVLSYEEV